MFFAPGRLLTSAARPSIKKTLTHMKHSSLSDVRMHHPRTVALCTQFVAALAVVGSVALFTANDAEAAFRLCNKTESRVGVAIGYKTDGGWATEGWWNIKPNKCEPIIGGPLQHRYYYVYALDYDQGGAWSGPAYLCTRKEVFTIEGANDCTARGFEKTGFIEVDTGEQQSWTVQLTEPGGTSTGGR